MVRNRIIFGILWVLSVVGISFYGGPVSYGLFLMLTAIPIVSLIYLLYVFFTYRIYQEIGSKNLVANESVPYYITLQNEKKILFTSIRIKFYSSFSEIEGIEDNSEYELGPGEGIRLETRLICKYRGEYEVGVKRIIITDLFRLFRFKFDNPEPLRVLVKPEISSDPLADGFEIPEDLLEGENNKDTPDVTIREYVPGDDIRRINWKQSARADKLFTRNEIGEEKRGVLILLDTCRYTEDEFKYIPAENDILKAVIALSLYYVRLNIPVNLIALQRGDGLMKIGVSTEKGFRSYYEEISGMIFEECFKGAELGKRLISTGAAMGENNIILVSSEINETTGIVTEYFKNMGKKVRLFLTGRQE